MNWLLFVFGFVILLFGFGFFVSLLLMLCFVVWFGGYCVFMFGFVMFVVGVVIVVVFVCDGVLGFGFYVGIVVIGVG